MIPIHANDNPPVDHLMEFGAPKRWVTGALNDRFGPTAVMAQKRQNRTLPAREQTLFWRVALMRRGNSMALTSQITPYNEQWPSMFVAERRLIAKVFEPDLIEIHHVGSTAVVGLSAKPEIDLLVEVRVQTNQVDRDRSMVSLGYVRGSNLSLGHHFYRKDVDGVRTHKVHVCLTGHWQIERMIRFRNLLIDNPQIRQEYQRLKLHLEASNRDGIGEYLANKAPFIDALMGPRPE